MGGSTYIIEVGARNADTDIGDGEVVLGISVPVEICGDRFDNDDDGDIDCFDADCLGDITCGPEVCDDGIDNDASGQIDCLDSASCAMDGACCPRIVAVGLGTSTGTVSPDTDVSAPSCGQPGTFDTSFEFTPQTTGTYVFDSAGSAFDTVVSLTDGCGGAELQCGSSQPNAAVFRTFQDLQPVVVHVDAASPTTPLNGGAVRLDVRFQTTETCDDGIDNDGADGIDCLDTPQCGADPVCCPVHLGVGTGTTIVPLASDSDTQNPSCAPVILDGLDTSFEFTPPVTGTYQIDTLGTPWNTVLSVEDGCGGALLDCNDDIDLFTPQSQITMMMQDQTTYVIYVDEAFPGGGGADVTLDITPLP